MKLDTWPNLVTMLHEQVQAKGDAPFLWGKVEDAYRPTSWRQAADQVNALARALRSYGLQPGDRVVLVSENAPHWAIADFAIMAAGGVSVPAYTTNTARDHAHILADSGARFAIVSTAALAAPLLQAAASAMSLERVIAIEEPEGGGGDAVIRWQAALDEGANGEGDPLAEAASIGADSLACLIYTSGTGGAPKGVMLSHRAMLANCVGAYELLLSLGLDEEVFLSFLPLSHSYEHSCGLMFPIAIGAEIYYAERVETLTTNLLEARPTVMTAVPRLYELMRGRILQGVKRQGGFKEKLFWRAVKLGRKAYEDPDAMGWFERLDNAIVDKVVRNKVRGRFGGRLKALVSGGAPLNTEIGIFFTALGLRLLQGYGQTEAAPVISCNTPDLIKLHTVGPPTAGTEVRIADDGEILVRGPLLMDGYWNLEEETAAALKDGWLHTGDIGVIDDDGYIEITDRKKDIIVISGGDNVSPQRVEGILALEPEIEQAMVMGDQRPHLVALVVPSLEFVTHWARENGKSTDLAELAGDKDLHSVLDDAVSRANAQLSVIEKVRRFAVADGAFTVENEMMTPTMKLRRHQILERYGERLEALY
jgi:long-chain acyl-CoA synthetase